MNTRGGLALIRSTWASWLQYRGFFFLLAFSWMIPPLVSLLVWRSVAAQSGSVGGLDQAGVSGYYLALILVNQVTYAQANWTVGDVIRSGGMNAWLLRPMAPLFNVLSSEIAGKLVYLIFCVPVTLALAVLLRSGLSTDLTHGVAFIVSLGLAWVLRFFWGLALALVAFWMVRADALLALQDILVFLLGGTVAPVFLLPAWLQTVAASLPFRYMVGFPVEVLTAQVSGAALWQGLWIQAAWAFFAVGLASLAWWAGQRRYTAVGG